MLAHLCHQLENNAEISSDTKNVSIFESPVSTLDSNEGNNNMKILAVKIYKLKHADRVRVWTRMLKNLSSGKPK